ncbi:autotransporter adhesin [Acinetobacter baylyi]|uniref:Autotransporter adhesin n=1 Tax=Acinetobacter baylyi TaxID=202950 RepID=A0ABU0USX4_ACIBI|nr:YadA-like family protein [Acinetobacter baylyi]MDQ1207654.1 autotransporter adhesin [Acinetobacter baylyi]MDR6105269.1 autotransporter adhesin [Acinetobacter baylyi]MDR6184525.1 autotransporter adhesin [Acinetobacter baylyi]
MKKIDTTFKKTTLGVYILAATLSSVTFADNLALGNGATNTKGIDNAVAIGDSALASQTGAVALGAGSNTATNATAASDVTIKDGNGNDITISASQFAGNSNIDSGDQVSVGSVGNERQIKNVAAGEVSSTSTDAVNGSQLYAVADTLAKEIKNTQTEVTEGKNVTVTSTTGANGQAIYNVATSDNVTFKSVTSDQVTVGNVSINQSGINAGNTQITNVAAGTKTTDAVNLGQLQSTVSIFGGGSTVNSDGSITNPTYNVNGGTYNNVGDALGALNQVDIDLGDRITNLQQTFNNRINDVEDKLSAGVASALALESAPYVAGKYTYAAGSGFYNGQSAIGVSLRKTADNGRWSLTGGVAAASQGEASFRIGINGVID